MVLCIVNKFEEARHRRAAVGRKHAAAAWHSWEFGVSKNCGLAFAESVARILFQASKLVAVLLL